MGVQTLVNGLVLGNTASTRVGMKITIRSIQFKGYTLSTATTGIDQGHRITLVLDRQSNGVAPALLTDYFTPGDWNGLRNLANRKRFKIIIDKTYALNASAEPGSWRAVKFYIKFRRPIIVEYNTANFGTVADIVCNSIYFVTVGSSAPGATAGSTYGNLRVRFTDM